MQDLKDYIKAEAARLGFCLCGFTGAEPLADYERYLRWLESEPLGTMAYLKRPDTLAKRADPHLLLPDVQSICVLAVPMGLQPEKNEPEVASYAHYFDYHEAILPMAETLLQSIQSYLTDFTPKKNKTIIFHNLPIKDDVADHQLPPAPVFSYRICIDSAPILERSLAVKAGLGWIGKSSMFVSPMHGSALFLCEILLSLPIEPDEPYTRDGCGSCTRCVNACPNHCIDPESRTIRADHCASYLTIEHKGDFTPEQSKMVGTHLFGCDACLRACPWNKKNTGNSPLPLAQAIPNMEDYTLSDKEFKNKFKNTPVLRTKAKGLRRNIEAVNKNIQTSGHQT
ncbi:MAG: tRNA epoxyqueuosine(34) reductase QueG [Anaerolineaceae bacterium]|nr:tRNA epoxyqueuosine(34) reductase QueG [Anaerolineaceae bacterium]